MECSGPHTLETHFLHRIIEESITVWYAHTKARATLPKARLAQATQWRGCCNSKPGIYGGLQCFWPRAPTLCKLV